MLIFFFCLLIGAREHFSDFFFFFFCWCLDFSHYTSHYPIFTRFVSIFVSLFVCVYLYFDCFFCPWSILSFFVPFVASLRGWNLDLLGHLSHPRYWLSIVHAVSSALLNILWPYLIHWCTNHMGWGGGGAWRVGIAVISVKVRPSFFLMQVWLGMDILFCSRWWYTCVSLQHVSQNYSWLR